MLLYPDNMLICVDYVE